jgi:hypothetical protein
MRKDLTVSVDAWGNIIVAGPVSVDSATTFVAKLDKDGNLLWHETLSHGDLFSASPAASWPPPAPERDSVEPLALDSEIEAYQSQLGRQGRLARWIGAALAFAGLFVFGAAGGAAISSAKSAAHAAQVTVARSGVDEAVDRRIDSLMDAVAIGASAPAAPAAVVSDDEITVDAMSAVDDEPEVLHGEPMPEVETLTEPVFDDVVGLRSQMMSLLTSGQLTEAVVVGERLVAADRESAFSYLCLGAALQDLGRGDEARANYDACVRNATRGDSSECMALGGRR